MNTDFDSWMAGCEAVAMRSEWCIDPQMPEWRAWFSQGLSADEAVRKLWDLVNSEL